MIYNKRLIIKAGLTTRHKNLAGVGHPSTKNFDVYTPFFYDDNLICFIFNIKTWRRPCCEARFYGCEDSQHASDPTYDTKSPPIYLSTAFVLHIPPTNMYFWREKI